MILHVHAKFNGTQYAAYCIIRNSIIYYFIIRKLKLLRAHLFSNAVKIMLFISDAQYYVPVKLCKAAGSMHFFKVTGKLLPKHVKLNRYIL